MNDSYKLKAIIPLLEQRNLDGLIIYSNGTHNIIRPGHFYYFSEFSPLASHNAVLVSRSGDVCLLIDPAWDSQRAYGQTWIQDIRGSNDFTKDLLDNARRMKILGSLGISGSRDMTDSLYSAIKKESKLEMADNIIEEIVRKKTPQELENVRKVALIADIGFQAFVDNVRPGVKEYEIAAEVEYAMRLAGAEDNFTQINSDKHNFALRVPGDRRLSEGDIVICEISPECRGQFIQLCRTAVLGKPNPVLVEKYAMLVRALEESLKVMKAGVPASIISTAMNKVISDAGYEKYCYPPYMRARAHGLGLGSIAPGAAIDHNTKANLESSQVIIVHPNQYLPETGYLACGETVLITDNGIEVLAKTRTRLYVKEY